MIFKYKRWETYALINDILLLPIIILKGNDRMERQIHEIFNDKIITAAREKYSMDQGSLKKIGGFENYVFGFTNEGREYILRITHNSHRDKEMLESELDFVEFLYQNGADVCMPVYSIYNQLVEEIPVDENNCFFTTAFSKAPGRHITPADGCDALYEEWGRSVGKLHRIAKNYNPKSTIKKRPLWYEDKIFTHVYEYLPKGHEVIADKLLSLTKRLKSLPMTADTFGLMHTDVHSGNFFADNGKITIFDFDDSSYQYFISDIAIALFYPLLGIDTTENKLRFSDRFLKAFFKGYEQENYLSPYQISLLPDFLKLREIELYVVIYRSCDMANPGPWETNYMKGRKESIENDTPFTGMDLDLTPFFKERV